MFFNPINLDNLLKLHLPDTKGAIPTALLVALIQESYSSFISIRIFPVKSRLALTTSTLHLALPIHRLYISLLVRFRHFPTTAYMISSIYRLVACACDNED